MVGGTIFHRWVIQREIYRVLVLNLSGKANGARNTDRRSLSLTAPSLLSMAPTAVDFLCYPDFDSPTVFAVLLDDEKGGRFAIRPQLSGMRVRQLYLTRPSIVA